MPDAPDPVIDDDGGAGGDGEIYERRTARCDPEQIVITAGTQQAIDIAIRVLLAHGDDVWVEDPGYPLTPHAVAARQGAAASYSRRCPRPDRRRRPAHGTTGARGVRHAFASISDRRRDVYSGPPLASLQGLDPPTKACSNTCGITA
jgi:hypothetical protein